MRSALHLVDTTVMPCAPAQPASDLPQAVILRQSAELFEKLARNHAKNGRIIQAHRWTHDAAEVREQLRLRVVS